ncbi:MAG TPA: phosphoribosyltransferase family protein [Bacteroidia bacterium]|jgi:predicted phosphoribosyltransferase|nr:phosphoribosyltransferase family protein [Bacteroidia bacterium]
MRTKYFRDREEAALLLAERLKKFRGTASIILAIPRGGVPMGAIIAGKLDLPLDIALSKKIGHPINKEFAIGSVSSDSILLDEHPEVDEKYIEEETVRIRALLRERYRLYKGNNAPLDIKGKTVIIVDDGIATGNTILVTIQMLRKKDPAAIVVAVPVTPHDQVLKMKNVSDEFIYLFAPDYFPGVGAFYENFPQVEDSEVVESLKRAESHHLVK